MDLQAWTFDVPRYCPPSLNPYVGPRFREVERVKRSLAGLLAGYALLAGVRRVDHNHRPVRHVRVRAVGWEGRTVPDPDNVLKILLDSCVRAHLIVDDAGADAGGWVRWDPPVLVRGAPDCLSLTLTDLEFRPPCRPEEDPHTRRLLANLIRRANRQRKTPSHVEPTQSPRGATRGARPRPGQP